MRLLLPFALCATLGLTACQPSMYRILAAAQGGEIVLDVSDEDRGNALGADAGRLTVRGAETVMWEIELDRTCTTSSPGRPFPVVYGQLPECYRVVTQARPLERDRIYLATGSGQRDGDGYFIPGPPVQNFEHRDIADRVSAWRPLG